MVFKLLLRLRSVASLPVFYILRLVYGLEIASSAVLGSNVRFVHGGHGTVIHPNVIIGDNVTIYHEVTIGQGDVYRSPSNMELIIIKEGAILCCGAKILCSEGVLTVGSNTIIGANAVLLQSTGDNEIWGGVPAKRIR